MKSKQGNDRLYVFEYNGVFTSQYGNDGLPFL